MIAPLRLVWFALSPDGLAVICSVLAVLAAICIVAAIHEGHKQL